MLRIEELNRTFYKSMAEHAQDLQLAGNDPALNKAIDAKLERSWDFLRGTTGTQSAPQGNTGPISVTITGDQTRVGTPGDMAHDRNTRLTAAGEANEQLTGSLPKFRSVIVKQ